MCSVPFRGIRAVWNLLWQYVPARVTPSQKDDNWWGKDPVVR